MLHKHHSKCWKCSPFCSSHMFTFGPIAQFHVATGSPDCWRNFVKFVCGFCSNHQQLLQILNVFHEISNCWHCQFEQMCWLHVQCAPLTMFLELLDEDIWLDILAYKRSQNTPTIRLPSPIAITRHNNQNVLFNRINYSHSLRFLAQKQNYRTQPPRVWKTTFVVFNLDQRELL